MRRLPGHPPLSPVLNPPPSVARRTLSGIAKMPSVVAPEFSGRTGHFEKICAGISATAALDRNSRRRFICRHTNRFRRAAWIFAFCRLAACTGLKFDENPPGPPKRQLHRRADLFLSAMQDPVTAAPEVTFRCQVRPGDTPGLVTSSVSERAGPWRPPRFHLSPPSSLISERKPRSLPLPMESDRFKGPSYWLSAASGP